MGNACRAHPTQDTAAHALVDGLLAAGLRPRLDAGTSLGARIRDSRRRRGPVIAVIGAAEATAGEVNLRDIGAGIERSLPAQALVDALAHAHADRAAAVVWP